MSYQELKDKYGIAYASNITHGHHLFKSVNIDDIRKRNAMSAELIEAVLSESIFDEQLIDYHWLSGETTMVSPIIVWGKEIDFQLNDEKLRDEYEQAIKRVCEKHKDLFTGGHVSNYDGSCPIYVRFYYADGVLDRLLQNKR